MTLILMLFCVNWFWDSFALFCVVYVSDSYRLLDDSSGYFAKHH